MNLSKFPNLFDDQAISTEKLSLYRSSKPLSKESKDSNNLISRLMDIGLSYSRYSQPNINPFTNNFAQELNSSQRFLEESHLKRATFKPRTIIEEEIDADTTRGCSQGIEENEPSRILEESLMINQTVSEKVFIEEKDTQNEEIMKKKAELSFGKCTPVEIEGNNNPASEIGLNETLSLDLKGETNSNTIIEKVDQGSDSIDFMEEEVKKTYEDMAIGTEAVETKEQYTATEKVVLSAKGVDTKGLIVMKDQKIETGNEWIENEKTEAKKGGMELVREHAMKGIMDVKERIEELKKEKLGFESEVKGLFGMEARKWMQNIGENVNQFVGKKEKENKEILMNMKTNVAETKKEFVSFKTELMESLGDFKAKLSQYIQNDVASELQTIIKGLMAEKEENQKYIEWSASKLQELLSEDTQSMTTDSILGTPHKSLAESLVFGAVADTNAPPGPRRSARKSAKKDSNKENQENKEKEKEKERDNHLHKTAIEGVLYLLKNGGIKVPHQSADDFKKQMERLLKTRLKEKVAPEVILDTLMDKTRKKNLNFKDLVDDKKAKNKRRTPVELSDEEKRMLLTKKFHIEGKPSVAPPPMSKDGNPPVIMNIDLSKKSSSQ